VRPISARIRAKTWRVSATGGLTSARWNGRSELRILSGAPPLADLDAEGYLARYAEAEREVYPDPDE
jgi:hypothetical protein